MRSNEEMRQTGAFWLEIGEIAGRKDGLFLRSLLAKPRSEMSLLPGLVLRARGTLLSPLQRAGHSAT